MFDDYETKRWCSERNGKRIVKRMQAEKVGPPWFNGRAGRREIVTKHKVRSLQLLKDILKEMKHGGT